MPKKKEATDYMPNLEGQELEDPDCVPLLEQSAAAVAKGIKMVAEHQVNVAGYAPEFRWT